MTDCPDELRSLYREGRVMPFVGAGASMAVTWAGGRGPSWAELVNEAANQLGVADPNLLRVRGSDLQILEYFKLKKGSFAPLTNWLSTRFAAASESDILGSHIHRSLCELSACHAYYTTNYDNFLERALTYSGRNVQVVNSELTINHNRSATEVVKFHGDFNTPDQMVLSESHYMDRMRLESAMDLKLRSDMLGRVLLFIGYSFRDQNVGYIFHVVNRLFDRMPGTLSGRRAYIILPDPSNFERELFNVRNIEVISVSGSDLTGSIGEFLSRMAD